MIPVFSKPTDAGDFDGAREPMRAIRDLINDCEAAFNCDSDVLQRAQAAFTALRALFGDNRPGEEIADAEMWEPVASALQEPLQLTAGALQCVAKLLPAGETHAVIFTGRWEGFAPRTIGEILDLANAALEPAKETFNA